MKFQLRIVKNITLIILVICVSALAAKTAWQIITPIQSTTQQQIRDNAFHSKSSSAQLAKTIVSSELFGELEKQTTTPPPQKPTEPRKPISLIGLVNSGDSKSYAIIGYSGKYSVISQGESLSTLGNDKIILSKIEQDAVILDRESKNEKITLNTSGTTLLGITAKTKDTAATAAQTKSTRVHSESGKEDKLPAKNSDFLGTAFNLKQLQINGDEQVFIITAGSDRNRLQQVDIRPGDIITHINEKTLDNYSLNQTLELFRDNTPISLRLKRGIETLEFTLEAAS